MTMAKPSIPFYAAWAAQEKRRQEGRQRAEERKRCSPLYAIVVHIYKDQKGNRWGDLTLCRMERQVSIHLRGANQCTHALQLFREMCKRYPDAFAAWLDTNAINGLRASELLAPDHTPKADEAR